MSEYSTVLSTLTAVLHDKSSAKKLTEVEMLLVLMERYSADSDPYKAYLLLCGYSFIGGAEESVHAGLLQKVHRRLLKYSSKKKWQESLENYKDKMYDSVRLYYIEESDAGCRMKRNTASTPALDREAAYINEIKTQLRKVNTRYAAKGTYTYKVSRQQGAMAEKTVRLDVSAPAQHRPSFKSRNASRYLLLLQSCLSRQRKCEVSMTRTIALMYYRRMEYLKRQAIRFPRQNNLKYAARQTWSEWWVPVNPL